MPEFSSLNGYTVKDTTARNIAKGRNQAVAFSDYATMIAELNVMEKDQYKTGQNIYIGIVGVPDLWVYSVESVVHNFSYVSDDDVVEKLTANTTIQAGYYKLAMLEGQKVDLTTVNEQLTKHTEDITELNKNMGGLTFGKDGDGNYGYYGADGSLVPFKCFKTGTFAGTQDTSKDITVDIGIENPSFFVWYSESAYASYQTTIYDKNYSEDVVRLLRQDGFRTVAVSTMLEFDGTSVTIKNGSATNNAGYYALYHWIAG